MIVDLTNFHEEAGFCDLLRQVTFCIAVASLRNERTLHIKQNYRIGTPYQIVDVCDVIGFELKPWVEGMGDSEWRMDSMNSCVRLTSAKLHKPKNLNISDKSFLDLWREAYRLVVPKPKIKQIIDAMNIDENYVGFHVRRTDEIVKCKPWGNIHESKLDLLEKASYRAIRSCLKKEKSNSIYLACDNEQSRIYWTTKLSRHRYQIVHHHALFDKSQYRQTSGADFMVDLFGLARCGMIVGTAPSGVPITASLINGGGTEYVWALDYTLRERIVNLIKRWPIFYILCVKVKSFLSGHSK